MNIEPANIEAITTWSTPLFASSQTDHLFLKEALLQHVYACKEQQKQAIDSHVAPLAKHQLFESQLDFLESDMPEVME